MDWPDEDALDAESEADDLAVGDVSPPNGSVRSSFRSKRPSYSRGSAEEPLLPDRHISISSYAQDRRFDSRLNQKIYIESEDLTLVIAGFSTKFSGLVLYSLLCVMSLGFAYLVFRWFPRWRVRLTGKPTALRICQWVAIEVSNNHIRRSSLYLRLYRTNGINSAYAKFAVKLMDVRSLAYLQTQTAIPWTKKMTPLSRSYVILTVDTFGSFTILWKTSSA